jgi:hypothetical protein
MSAIIANYELTIKDGSNPSTSTAAANLDADRYSEIIPLERSFMGEIHMHFAAGPAGNMIFQVSNDEGAIDDAGVARINENNIITNWVTHTTTAVAATDASYRIALSDIGARWGRLFFDRSTGTGAISSCRVNLKGY